MHEVSISERFHQLARLQGEGNVTLWEVEEALGDDGASLFVLFLCVPFLFPMPIPGISQAFAVAICLAVRRIVARGPSRLPQFLGTRTVRAPMVRKAAETGGRLFARFEHLLRPRLGLLTAGAGRFLAGVAIVLAAVALALPFPPVVPLTNTAPAVAIIVLTLGLLMRDGIAVLLGHVLHLATWAYLATLGGVLLALALRLWKWVEEILTTL